MNAVVTLIIAVIVLIMVSPLIAEYGGKQLEENANKQQDSSDAKTTGNKFKKGDTVCDMEIKIYGELDRDRSKSGIDKILDEVIPSSKEFHIYMGSNAKKSQIADVIHRNCFTVGDGFGESFNWLAGVYSLTGNNGIRQLSVLTTPLDNFELGFTGISKTTGLNLVEGIESTKPEKRWSQLVDVNFGEINSLPWEFSETYYLDNVKNDDYTLYIVAEGRSINNMQEGSPLIYDLRGVRFQ